MLTLDLTDNEARVIGCLMEKSITTPDQYPLTLNALTNACNQKSARAPVMSLSQGTVQHTVRELERKHLIRVEENFKRGVEKYTQRFCNSRSSVYCCCADRKHLANYAPTADVCTSLPTTMRWWRQWKA